MRLDLNKYLLIYSDCVPIKGYNQSILCDFTRNKIVTFATSFFHLFEEFNSKTLSQIYNEFDEMSQKNVDSFVLFLLENNFGQLEDNIDNFKKIDFTDWDTYGEIDNVIIDIDQIKHDFGSIIPQLNLLGCRYLQLRLYSNLYNLNEILEIVKMAEDTSIEGVEVLMKYNSVYSTKDYISFFENHFLISALYVFGYKRSKQVKTAFGYKGKVMDRFIQSTVFFTDEVIISEKNCGIIDKSYFCVNNINDFIHNKNYNSCLNKKISIDKNGQIKNCPSLTISYGNIKDKEFNSVVNQGFKKLWNINKDEIKVCKDCEYRYVCTDCRAYLEIPEDIYSKPLKCGYNPYINEWKEWKKNVPQNVLKRYEII